MTKRSPLLVVALTFLTFTLYAYYWLFQTTRELREETGREDLNPITDVVLAVISFGLWGVWAAIRNARIVHEEMGERGAAHTDRSLGVAAFAAMTLVSGWSWLLSMALLQEDYNRLGETDFVLDVPVRPAAAKKVRVEAQPVAAASAWRSAPVFTSDAPMPIVF